MGITKLESYFFQPKKFFFSKYCQNCNRKYCEFHKLYYKFEIISQYKNENVHIRSKPITLQNWKIKIQEWWNFTAKIERYKLFDLIPRKLCTIFVVAHKDLTSFFFLFFTRAVSRGKSGRQVYESYTCTPNWSMPGRQFYLRGWEGGTRTETRPRRARTRRISGVKATGPSRRVKRSRNQEPGPTFTGGELPCVEKASDGAASSSHLPTLLYPLPRPLL